MTDHSENAMNLAREGKDPKEEQLKFHKQQLLYFKELTVDKVEVSTAGPGNACDECLKLHGKQFTTDEALKNMPLPVKTCTCDVFGTGNGYCRCLYLPVVD